MKKSRSFNFNLIVVLSSILLVTVLFLSLLLYNEFRNFFISELNQSRQDTLSMSAQQISSVEEKMTTFSSLIANDTEFQSYVISSKLTNSSKLMLNTYISNLYLKYYQTIGSNLYPFGLIVICDNGYMFTSERNVGITNNILSSKWFEEHRINMDDEFSITTSHPSNSKENDVLVHIKTLRKGSFENYNASVIVYIDEQHIANCYENILSEYNSIYVLDENYEIISSRQNNIEIENEDFDIKKIISEDLADNNYKVKLIENEAYLFSKQSAPNSNLLLFEVISLDWLLQSFQQTTIIIVIITFILGGISIFLSVLFSRKISRPLLKLCDEIDKFEKSDELFPIVEESKYREIVLLRKSYNRMIKKHQVLMNNLHNKEQEKRKSDMAFLRAQINPHFLYNTLFTIKCTVDMQKTENASEMISHLITMLRSTVDSQTIYTTLAEECQYLRIYTALQELRFGNNLSLVLDIPIEFSSYQILRNMLQPIVENAIFHGIEPSGVEGIIRIYCQKQDEDLIIDIYNNGLPMSKIPDLSMSLDDDDGYHIGLRNINMRLKLHFGERYGLEFIPNEKEVCVRLRLPII